MGATDEVLQVVPTGAAFPGGARSGNHAIASSYSNLDRLDGRSHVTVALPPRYEAQAVTLSIFGCKPDAIDFPGRIMDAPTVIRAIKDFVLPAELSELDRCHLPANGLSRPNIEPPSIVPLDRSQVTRAEARVAMPLQEI
jgi:hypothetical protein